VTEINPYGYGSTAAIAGNDAQEIDEDTLVIVPLAGGETSQGNLFGDTPVLHGFVFEDNDGDGIQDPEEAGIEGVNLTLDQSDTTLTDSSGYYSFNTMLSDVHKVFEQDPAGYHSTTPYTVTVDVNSILTDTLPVNFGDTFITYTTSIFGTVFLDYNANGIMDLTDTGMQDVEIILSTDLITGTAMSQTTNHWGQYTFPVYNPGTYFIVETDPVGYVSTNAIPGSPDVTKEDNNTLKVIVSNLGRDMGDNMFGDSIAAQPVTVSGMVWDDNGAGGGIYGNGIRDGAEPPLAGAVIALSSGMTQTTGHNGTFSLYGLANEAITLTEINPSGYESTNAIPGNDAAKIDNDSILISSLSGGSTSANNMFGDVIPVPMAILTGTVFYDYNFNGSHQSDTEPGIPGVEITMEDTSAGMSSTTYTDSLGDYAFSVAAGNNVRIISSGPGGDFFPLTPENVTLTPTDPITYPNNNFAYGKDVAIIQGIVFDDVNGNGTQDSEETGLVGAVVTLDDITSVVTTAKVDRRSTGTFAFEALDLRAYNVHEDNPPNYVSTTPDNIQIDVTVLYTSYEVNFGDKYSPPTPTPTPTATPTPTLTPTSTPTPTPSMTPTPPPTSTPTVTPTPTPTPSPSPTPLITPTPIAHYTFDTTDEGWQFAGQIPPYDTPMSGYSPGMFGLAPNGSAYCFSYLFSPDVTVEDGNLYRAAWTIGSTAKIPNLCLQFRLRANQQGAWSSWDRIVTSAMSQAPYEILSKDYDLFINPRVTGTSGDNAMVFSLDLLSFDMSDDVSSWIFVDELLVELVNAMSGPQLVMYDFEAGADGWMFAGPIPPFDAPLSSAAGGSLGLDPNGSTNSFSYWFSPDVGMASSTMYRVVWEVESTASDADETVQFRLRQNQKGAWAAWNRTVSSNLDNAPAAGIPKLYDVIVSPVVTGIGDDDKLLLSFDILSFDAADDENSQLLLNEVIVEETTISP
jgi:hypothetical protein